MELLLLWVLIFGGIPGLISASIASNKNRSAGGFFLLGFFFSVIGIVIALLAHPGEPKAPQGMITVTCPRCNARQNIAMGQMNYECWQCKLIAPAPFTRSKDEPEDWQKWLGKTPRG